MSCLYLRGNTALQLENIQNKPDKLSHNVKGLLLLFMPFFLVHANPFGHHLNSHQLQPDHPQINKQLKRTLVGHLYCRDGGKTGRLCKTIKPSKQGKKNKQTNTCKSELSRNKCPETEHSG